MTEKNLEEEIKITKKNIIESKTQKCKLIYQNKLDKIQGEIMKRKEQIKREEKFSFVGLFSYAIEVTISEITIFLLIFYLVQREIQEVLF